MKALLRISSRPPPSSRRLKTQRNLASARGAPVPEPAGAGGDLHAARAAAGAAAQQAQQLKDLEAKLKDARDSIIAGIASVKDDDRGMVITLPGEVLFKTAKFDLKAGSLAKLDEIADALEANQPIVVYGYRQRRRPRHERRSVAEPGANGARLPGEQGIPRISSPRRARDPTRPSPTARPSKAARRTGAWKSWSSPESNAFLVLP